MILRRWISGIVSTFLVLVIKIKGDTNLEHVKAIWSRYAQVSNGATTYYGEYPGGGACALDPLPPINSEPGWIKVAAGKKHYQKSLGCGMCLEINGNGEPVTSATGGTTPVKGPLKATIMDLKGESGLDLYIPGNGKWKTSFKAIECPTVSGKEGNIQFRFTGSNPWSIKLQVRNAKVQTAGMEILNGNEWVCLRRTDDNYFTADGLGELKFPIKVRVTSISNEQLESTIKAIDNDVSISTTIQYKGFIADSKPESIKCYGQGKKAGAVDEMFCKGKADGIYADPKDCTAFYKCAGERAFKSYCPKGMRFNAKIMNCDKADNVPCPQGEGEKATTAAPGTSSPPSKPPSKPEEVTTAVTSPTKGPGGEITTPTKPGGQATASEGQSATSSPSSKPEEATTAVASPSKGSGGEITTPTKPPGQPASTSKPVGPDTIDDKNFCKERDDGMYPDVNDCTGFIMCSNGNTYKKDCPPGLLYNADLKVCDWPRNVVCLKKT